ncbi:MAG TPA: LuxR C-terminal-related transcriptional regulator [Polyangia bacterium]|nr:LuxR C-terminal-related transcriptional regulator [Polyangia bacterium]
MKELEMADDFFRPPANHVVDASPMTCGEMPRAKWRSDAPPESEALSTRERQVVSLLRAGLSRKEVAFELGLTDTTVRVFLFRAQRKTRATR